MSQNTMQTINIIVQHPQNLASKLMNTHKMRRAHE